MGQKASLDFLLSSSFITYHPFLRLPLLSLCFLIVFFKCFFNQHPKNRELTIVSWKKQHVPLMAFRKSFSELAMDHNSLRWRGRLVVGAASDACYVKLLLLGKRFWRTWDFMNNHLLLKWNICISNANFKTIHLFGGVACLSVGFWLFAMQAAYCIASIPASQQCSSTHHTCAVSAAVITMDQNYLILHFMFNQQKHNRPILAFFITHIIFQSVVYTP